MGTTTESNFQPAWWLPGGHCQTLWPALFGRCRVTGCQWQRLELDDGDFLQLLWGPPREGPVLVVLHGLAGCATSVYVQCTLGAAAAAGFQGVVMQYRGAGAVPNRLPRFYHSGAIDDLQAVLDEVRRQAPGRAVMLAGYSLGGIILLNYLGERGERADVSAAVAVSNPFDLAASAAAIDRGFARVYQWDILRNLRRLYHAKFARWDDGPVPLARLGEIDSLRTFDDRITAPLHGFRSADHYYETWRCDKRMGRIRVPTLVLTARDDPFVPAQTIPDGRALSADVELEVSTRGGHVGFVAGRWPGHGNYWAPRRVVSFLEGLPSAQAVRTAG